MIVPNKSVCSYGGNSLKTLEYCSFYPRYTFNVVGWTGKLKFVACCCWVVFGTQLNQAETVSFYYHDV